MPPVVVAAARLPWLSRATAPTVPDEPAAFFTTPFSSSLRLTVFSTLAAASWFFRATVEKYSGGSCGRPASCTMASAPVPAKNTSVRGRRQTAGLVRSRTAISQTGQLQQAAYGVSFPLRSVQRG